MSPAPDKGAGSIFSSLRGLGDEPEAEAAAAPAQESPEAVQALKKKIEQLEARLSQQPKQPLPSPQPLQQPPQTQPPQARLDEPSTRITALEAQLKSAQEQAISASVMLREREEAQKAAHRETESLLKNMAASRRSEELDRQLHEQLAANRKRVEELEAKLLATVLAAAPGETQERLAAAQNMLASRLESCEVSVAALSKTFAEMTSAFAELRAAVELMRAGLATSLRSEWFLGLAQTEEKLRDELERGLALLREARTKKET